MMKTHPHCQKCTHAHLLGQTFDFKRFSVMALIFLIANFKPLFEQSIYNIISDVGLLFTHW